MNPRRRRLATVAGSLGVPVLLRLGRRLGRRPGRALVLMYHSIGDVEDYLSLSVRPQRFDAQLALLKRRARVVPLRELVERLRDPEALREDIAAITFDDGYRDNLDNALPVLQKHGCPATVFVTTGFIDRSVMPIGDRLKQVLEAAWARSLPAHAWPHERDLADVSIRTALANPGHYPRIAWLTERLKGLPAHKMEERFTELERVCKPSARLDVPMLDWNGVRRLAAAGLEIASHTVSHPSLSALSAAEAERELRESKHTLEAEINAPVAGFAYPNGAEGDFNESHARLLRQLGYTYACSAIRGVNRPGSDPFQLRRMAVGNDSSGLFSLRLAVGGQTQPIAT